MPEESIENITKSDNTFASTFVETCTVPIAKFNENSRIRNNIDNFRKLINVYIFYTFLNTDFPLDNSLFGPVEIIKNADPDK